MTHPDCSRVRGLLHEWLDGELGAAFHGVVKTHLQTCAGCGAELESHRATGDMLRASVAAGVPAEALARMASRVASQASAEARQSMRGRLNAAFGDMRFVFAGAGSVAATLICALTLAGMLHAASRTNDASLASVMARISAPRGTTANPYSVDPRLLPPRVMRGSLVMPAVLVDDVPYLPADEDYAFSGVLTSEGRVAGIKVMPGGVIDQRTLELLRSIHDSRFQPARLKTGEPVAMNFVWVHSDVTIKPKKVL